MSAILTEDLRKHYGPVKALDGLNLRVEPGTVFGFLGPNGAGKSTTIRLLTGLARPTSGRGQVAGVDISQRNQLAPKIGYLPEEPAFYPWMTPLEYLDHIGAIFGLDRAARTARSRELLAMASLEDVARRRIGGFSRGMRQRLGLAQALVNHPDVLLLDEPASALDPAGRRDVLDLIVRLKGECTVFMSTHILADVERVCDTIGIIDRGKMIVEAPQAELVASYTIPAIELECEPGCEASFREWIGGLKNQPWFDSLAMNGTQARVIVKDLDTARPALLSLASASGLALRRYEIVTPSLEDVFLRLVGQEGK